MKKLVRKVAYLLDDPYLPNHPIMQTGSGWWQDSQILLSVTRSMRERKSLKRVLYENRITRKQWRRFVEIHPAFAALMRRYKRERHFESKLSDLRQSRILPYLPTSPQSQVTVQPKSQWIPFIALRAVGDYVAVGESVSIEIERYMRLVPHLFYKGNP